MKPYQRIVVKVGTSSLTYETGKLNLRFIRELVFALSDIKNSGREVVLVSSGSIGVGAGKLGIDRPKEVEARQAAAAVGQCALMAIYDSHFLQYGHTVAQVLLNKENVENATSRQNIINTFDVLLRMQVVPIVNENDTVSVEGLLFGDNDTLSAMVSVLTEADLLIMLTDTDGLYNADPRKDASARHIPRVAAITDEIRQAASGKGSRRGTGGMVTKLAAAEIATKAGIPVVIASGENPSVLFSVLDGKSVGTFFESVK